MTDTDRAIAQIKAALDEPFGPITCAETELWFLLDRLDAKDAEIERLREAGIGYSQQTVDALTAERDKLRAAVEALREVVQWTRGMFQEAADRGDDDAGPVIEEHDAALRLADEAMGNDVERAA